ncbi:GumC family protein [Sphingomonas sp. FW199]|uniref:GumC family protein n=1 Tax=Sphingomonas sp. FW199 TaxID=3400217 RepID=UPI003CEA7326
MIWARRLMIIVVAGVCLLLATVVAAVIPRQYEATARVAVDLARVDPSTGRAIAPTQGSAKAMVQGQMAVIKDYVVAGAVVDKMDWVNKPELKAAYAARPPSDDRDIRRFLAQTVMDNTTVEVNNAIPNLIDIKYRSTSSDAARRIVTAVREAYIEQVLAFKRNEAASDARWLRVQSETLKKDLAAAEERRSAFEKRHNIILPDGNTDLETERLRALSASAAVPQVAAPQIPRGPTPSQVQLGQVDAQLASMAETLGPNHPQVQALQRQRAALASAASREQAMAATPAQGTVNVQGMINAQAQKVLSQRGLIGEAQRLAGDVAILKDQLSKMSTRAAEFELLSKGTDAGVSALGNVVAPESPLSLLWLILPLAGVLVGLIIGLIAAVAIELMWRRVRGAEDLSALPNLPVLGALTARPARRGMGWWLGFPRREQGMA